jgi:hypothetical protein
MKGVWSLQEKFQQRGIEAMKGWCRRAERVMESSE